MLRSRWAVLLQATPYEFAEFRLRDFPGSIHLEMGHHHPTVNDRPATVTADNIDKRRQRERTSMVVPMKHAHY